MLTPLRVLLPAVLVLGVLAGAAPSAHAAGSGEMVVVVEGPGTVTGTGINCPAVSCSHSRTWSTQNPPTNLLTADPDDGYRVQWEGCAVQEDPNKCAAGYGDPETGEAYTYARFVDGQAPTVGITSPAANERFGPANRWAVVNVTAADNVGVAGVHFMLSGVPVTTDSTAPYTHTFDTASWAEGSYALEAEAYDARNNKSTANRMIVVDRTAPALSVSGFEEGVLRDRVATTLNFDDGDASRTQCRAHPKDATPPEWGECTAADGHTVTPDADGEWTISVRAVDAAGNPAEASRRFRVDGTAPVVSVTGAPSETWVNQGTEVTLNATATDANLASIECREPGGTWNVCGWDVASMTDENATEGWRTWAFRARDGVGHVSAPVEYTWVSDGSPPQVQITSGPEEGGTVPAGEVSFEHTAGDQWTDVESVTCSWGDGAFGDCAPATLGPGSHRFRVRAEDSAGFVAVAERNFVVAAPQSGGPRPGGNGGTTGGGPLGGGPETGGPVQDGPGPARDTTAPTLTVTAPRSVKAAKLRKGVRFTVGCSEACRGTAVLAGPKGLKRTLTVSGAGTLKLKAAAGALRKALGRKRSAKLRLTVTVADAAGNQASRKLTLVLRR